MRSAIALACLLALGRAPAFAADPASAPPSSLSLPSFAWVPASGDPGSTASDRNYFTMSAGFEVTRLGHGATMAGPTYGLNGGKSWRDGNLVWGFEGGVEYDPAYAHLPSSSLFTSYSRDLAAGGRFKLGYLVTPDVLVYSSVGALATHDNWRVTPALGGFSRDDLRLRGDVRAGVEWAVTPNLSVGLEVGVQPALTR